MPTELPPSPLRVVDVDKMREEFAAIEARQAVLTHAGQKLLARIRPTSKYYGQGVEGHFSQFALGQQGNTVFSADRVVNTDCRMWTSLRPSMTRSCPLKSPFPTERKPACK